MSITIFTPKKLSIIFVTALIALTVLLFFEYLQTENGLIKLKAGQNLILQAPEGENEKIISELGKLLVLPENEIPTIATVTDVNKLKSVQSFFANAKNGDKFIIYTGAKKAILFDPKLRKVIDVTTLSISISPATSSAPATPKK